MSKKSNHFPKEKNESERGKEQKKLSLYVSSREKVLLIKEPRRLNDDIDLAQQKKKKSCVALETHRNLNFD